MKNHAILLISCADQIGITASVTNFVFKNGGNIIGADQHIDEQADIFFMRIEWSLDDFALTREDIRREFKPIADKFKMDWNLYFTDAIQRVALFVSRPQHCLTDILLRHRSGQLSCEIPLMISNHPNGEDIAKTFGIRFVQMEVNSKNKAEQERVQLKLLNEERIDLVLLARYHQILSESFIEAFRNRIINIHHSFLPAFAGKNPYGQAYEKGVKIIGATSHYVTKDLDQGPIIEQDTARVTHRDEIDDLRRKGADLEKIVFSRAVLWHLERKILSYGNKTVVFG